MAGSAPHKIEITSVAKPVLAGVIVIFIIILGMLVSHFLGEPPKAQVGSGNTSDTEMQWIRKMSLETEGDLRKLAPADQQRVIQKLGLQGAPSQFSIQYQLQKQGQP